MKNHGRLGTTPDEQGGLRAGYSSEDQVMRMVEDAMKNKNTKPIIYFDVKKVFDKIW